MHSLQLNHEARFYSGLAHSESLGLTKQADSCTDIFTQQHFPQRPLFVILNCCTYFPFLSKETIHSILSVKDLFLFLLISVFFWGGGGNVYVYHCISLVCWVLSVITVTFRSSVF